MDLLKGNYFLDYVTMKETKAAHRVGRRAGEILNSKKPETPNHQDILDTPKAHSLALDLLRDKYLKLFSYFFFWLFP